SLVHGDYAKNELPGCWINFQQLAAMVKRESTHKSGSLEIYGIPAYVPTTFAAYVGKDGPFCMLEPGIAVGPDERPFVYFDKTSDKDVYSALYKIYAGILANRTPLLAAP